MSKVKLGFIVCAGKQTRFGRNTIPKALVTINHKCLLDINYSLMQKYCENVYVICSFENQSFFNNDKYRKIVIESGLGSGDAVLKAINILLDKHIINISDDKIIICWGDSLVKEEVYKRIIEENSNHVIVPCIYEKNPYVQFKELENNKLLVLFSKYNDNIFEGYHDMCIFLSPIDILYKALTDFKLKFYIEQYSLFLTDSTDGYYNHRHNDEFEFLDIFNDTDITGKIIELDKSLSTFSFNTVEELNKYLEEK